MKAFYVNLPVTKPVGKWDGRIVREFDEDWYFWVDDKEYCAKAGTRVDGSSVPRWPVLWWLFGDKAEVPGDAHDILYRKETNVPKDYADNAYLALMEFANDPESAAGRKTMYWAVCAGGGSSYQKKSIDDKLCEDE